MTTLSDLEQLAGPHKLAVFGAFHPDPEDGLGETGTLVMFGPEEPGFWHHVTQQPEWRDGAPDPMDRWSARVIGQIASGAGGAPLFPFGGPPYHPFYRWALKTGRAWTSPVTLLVHDAAGLMLSYRGAIAVRTRLALPDPPAASPCDSCADRPCLVACPVGALDGAGYDLATCHAFLDTKAGADCLSFGCAVRRACPVSQAYGRLTQQSSYHMGLFHR
ncbi:hypothetical protein DEA8626_00045 [Defluviimonas aquaemixtae]|uniref:4Fe-4S ferredoxin-type domain-containing protein n=1 Tax=Albidovulum aquaemixtae TaxID=1542388 RepID=A0A2R8B1L9_9RHOB|nr:ferredoxin [Defluviimonas aquaemixtae]SPH16536.1 hypothetical protein DEA8626_00045 [Defluviimonas aquaemixtae]